MTLQKQTKIAIMALVVVAAISIPSVYAQAQSSLADYCDPAPTSTVKAKYWICHDLDPRITALESITVVNGTDGINGVNGTTGPQGIQGINGTNGLNGTEGIQGIQGLQGIQGIPGPVGTGFVDTQLTKMIYLELTTVNPSPFVYLDILLHPTPFETTLNVDFNVVSKITKYTNGTVVEVMIPSPFVFPPNGSGAQIEVRSLPQLGDYSVIHTCNVLANQTISVCDIDGLIVDPNKSVQVAYNMTATPSPTGVIWDKINLGHHATGVYSP